MTPEAWKRVKAIFAAARDLAPAERAPLLDSACGGDPELRAEVESLLAAADGADDFLAVGIQTPPPTSRSCSSCGKPLPRGAGFCPSCGTATPTETMQEAGTEQRQTTTKEQVEDQRPSLQAAVGDEYEIQGQIGHGGFGVVFRAHDRKLKRLVAIKVLRAELFEAKTARSRFRQEAQAAAGLRHPNIIPIFAVGEKAGVSYIVMPLIEGENLADVLEREGKLSMEEARRILREAADALHCAHGAGIVHRDIKPQNLMLEGPGRRVLIMDFGIARVADAESGTLTATGVAIGTPQYMSPEQAGADTTIDHRSDIYSLGVVAYEMLAGHPPFEGRSGRELVRHHLLTPPADLRRARPEVPADLAAIVMRCLAKRRDERWGSASQLLAAIDRGAATVTKGEVRLTWATVVRRAGSRKGIGIAVGGSVVTAVALAGILWLSKRGDGSVQAPKVSPPAVDSVPRGDTTPTVTPPSNPSSERSGPAPGVPRSSAADSFGRAARRAGSPPTRASSLPTAPAFGFLTINSDPFGTVFVDGVEIGDVPVVHLPLTPGRHIIEVRREGFQTVADTVEVVAGNPIRLGKRLIAK